MAQLTWRTQQQSELPTQDVYGKFCGTNGIDAMDAALDNALKRQEELRRVIESSSKELEEINVFLTLHKRFSERVQHRGDVLPSESATESANQSKEKDESTKSHRRGNPAAVARMAEATLKDNRRPMTRGELANEIERRGLMLPGSDNAQKSKYVGTILWRKADKFKNYEGRGYWLVGAPLPPSADDILSGRVTAIDLLGKAED